MEITEFSSAEYLPPTDLMNELALAVHQFPREFFAPRQNIEGLPYDQALEKLTKRSISCPKSLELLLREPVNTTDSHVLIKYLVRLNDLVGEATSSRHGIRRTPMLVFSKDHPWASFIVPNYDPLKILGQQVHSLLSLSKRAKKKNLFIVGICLIIVLTHPFSDCNGRTMRLFLFKMLLEKKSLGVDDAFYFASFDGTSKSGFLTCFYEIRNSCSFEAFLNMF